MYLHTVFLCVFLIFCQDYCWGASSSSILDIMRDAKNVSMIVKKQHVQAGDHEYEPLTIDELFYMATLGGAKGTYIKMY